MSGKSVAEIGSHDITYHLDNGYCTADSVQTVEVLAVPYADAGIDDEACGLEHQLAASLITGTGYWKYLQEVVFMPDTNKPEFDA